MGSWDKDLYGQVENPIDLIMSSNSAIIPGSVIMAEPTASNAGEVTIATTTAALNALGCAMDSVPLYSVVQGAEMAMLRVGSRAPFAVWKFRISGTSVKGAALAMSAPAQILTNGTASTTGLVVTSIAVGTIDMSGGLIKGKYGANAGVVRKQTSHNNNADTNVVVPFPNDIPVGDLFIRVPYSRSTIAVQMVATSIDEANGAIATGTGIPLNVVEVIIDEVHDEAYVLGCFRTHFFNSLA